jgi:hypothetical protein
MAKQKPGTQLAHGAETIEEKRARILQDATPALRAELDWFQDWFDKEFRHSLLSRRELGNRYKKIYDDTTTGRNTYGVHAVEQISEYFGWDDGVIYNSMKFARLFTEEEVRHLTELRMPDGRLLSFTHIVQVLSIADRAKRKELIDQAVAEGWTSKQLAYEISPDLKPKKPITDRRGRPLAIPRDFDAVLSQMESFADDFLNRADKVWQNERHSLDAKFIDLTADDMTKERAKKIKSVAEKLAELNKTAKRLEEEALAVHKEFLKTLDKKPTPKPITTGK